MLKQQPSARLNRRYLLVKGSKDDVERALLEYLGILGWSRAAPVIESHNGNLIIAVNRSEIEHVRAACALYAKKISVLGVSGTLKGLEKKYTKLK